MTDDQLNTLAAAFARSNMGHRISDFSKLTFKNLDSAVCRICGDLIENDDHYDMFLEEAEMWKSILQDECSLQEYRISSPDVFKACGVGHDN